MKRSSTLPSVRNSAATGGAGVSARPKTKTQALAASRPALALRRGRASTAPTSRIQAAISTPVQGRMSVAAHGKAAERRQVCSKSARPAPTSRAVAGASGGSHASAAQRAKPPPSRGPDNGIRIRLSSGPTSDTRPNTATHSGSSAAATATLANSKAAPSRARRGHRSGKRLSAVPPAHTIAAHAPTLITALGDSAEAGSHSSMAAAAKVSVAAAVVSRPKTRAQRAAPSMIHARTHGGSAPVIKV